MRIDDHEQQARAFLEYQAKHPDVPVWALFERWASSKDLYFADYWAIRRLVHAELVVRGQAAPADSASGRPEDAA